MTARSLILGLALAFILLLTFLTLRVMAEQGVDVLVVVSLFVLAILGFGVLGALTSSTDD